MKTEEIRGILKNVSASRILNILTHPLAILLFGSIIVPVRGYVSRFNLRDFERDVHATRIQDIFEASPLHVGEPQSLKHRYESD